MHLKLTFLALLSKCRVCLFLYAIIVLFKLILPVEDMPHKVHYFKGLIWSITYMVLIYYTPSIINNNGDIKVPIYYYFSLASIFAVNEMLNFFMLSAIYAFFCRLSDPRFGGTYMALYNTFYFLGWLIPNTLVLKMMALLTFSTCSKDIRNSCLTPDLKSVCAINGGSCEVFVDGYYITVIMCMVIGFIWYFSYRNKLKNYQQ